MYRNNYSTYNNYSMQNDYMSSNIKRDFHTIKKTHIENNEKITFDDFICKILDIVAMEKQYSEDKCDENHDIIFDKLNKFIIEIINDPNIFDKSIIDDLDIIISNIVSDEIDVDNINNISFLSCILYSVKDTYDQLTDDNKQIYIIHFLKKIQFELENKSEYLLYFDCLSLLENIKNHYISDELIKFIVLYLNINLIILDDTSHDKNKIIFIYDDTKPGKEFRMNIVLYKNKISSNKNESLYYVITYCNIKLWKSETPILKIFLLSDNCVHLPITNRFNDIKYSKSKSLKKESEFICKKNNTNLSDDNIIDDNDSTNEIIVNENIIFNYVNDNNTNENNTNENNTDENNMDENNTNENNTDENNTDENNMDENNTDKNNIIVDEKNINDLKSTKKHNKSDIILAQKSKNKKKIENCEENIIKKYNKTSLLRMNLREIIGIAENFNILSYSGKTKKGENKTKKKSILIDEILNVQ